MDGLFDLDSLPISSPSPLFSVSRRVRVPRAPREVTCATHHQSPPSCPLFTHRHHVPHPLPPLPHHQSCQTDWSVLLFHHSPAVLYLLPSRALFLTHTLLRSPSASSPLSAPLVSPPFHSLPLKFLACCFRLDLCQIPLQPMDSV